MGYEDFNQNNVFSQENANSLHVEELQCIFILLQ